MTEMLKLSIFPINFSPANAKVLSELAQSAVARILHKTREFTFLLPSPLFPTSCLISTNPSVFAFFASLSSAFSTPRDIAHRYHGNEPPHRVSQNPLGDKVVMS